MRDSNAVRIQKIISNVPGGDDSACRIGIDVQINLRFFCIDDDAQFRLSDFARGDQLTVAIECFEREPVFAIAVAFEAEALAGHIPFVKELPGLAAVAGHIELDFNVITFRIVDFKRNGKALNIR